MFFYRYVDDTFLYCFMVLINWMSFCCTWMEFTLISISGIMKIHFLDILIWMEPLGIGYTANLSIQTYIWMLLAIISQVRNDLLCPHLYIRLSLFQTQITCREKLTICAEHFCKKGTAWEILNWQLEKPFFQLSLRRLWNFWVGPAPFIVVLFLVGLDMFELNTELKLLLPPMLKPSNYSCQWKTTLA